MRGIDTASSQMGQGRAQASPLTLGSIKDPRADKKSAEARFRGCESERPVNSKRDRYDSRDSGKASVSFLCEREYRKGCDIFFKKGRGLASNVDLLTDTLLIL